MEDFKERRIRKIYWALVRGRPSEKKISVDAPVGRLLRGKIQVTPFGRKAETAFKVLRSGDRLSWIEARPLTGRTHQIRAHLAWIGHPVAGDPDFDRKGFPRPSRMMLHAHALSFTHPVTGRPVSFEAPAPRDFKEFFK